MMNSLSIRLNEIADQIQEREQSGKLFDDIHKKNNLYKKIKNTNSKVNDSFILDEEESNQNQNYIPLNEVLEDGFCISGNLNKISNFIKNKTSLFLKKDKKVKKKTKKKQISCLEKRNSLSFYNEVQNDSSVKYVDKIFKQFPNLKSNHDFCIIKEKQSNLNLKEIEKNKKNRFFNFSSQKSKLLLSLEQDYISNVKLMNQIYKTN